MKELDEYIKPRDSEFCSTLAGNYYRNKRYLLTLEIIETIHISACKILLHINNKDNHEDTNIFNSNNLNHRTENIS